MEVLRIQKWGNSQGIRLSKKLLKDLLEEVLEKVSLIFQFGTLNFHVIFL